MRHLQLSLVALLFCLNTGTAQETPKLLIIGIDGCRPDALRAARTPHLDRLVERGAYSDQAQTGDVTISGPGWSSMLTGVWREKHGVRDNGFENHNLNTYPHFFRRLKERRPTARTASVVHWAPINRKIVVACDHARTRTTDAEVTAAAERVLALPGIDVVFVHLDEVDGAGHRHGFHPAVASYLGAIEKADGYVGRLVAAVEGRPTRDREAWLILVSTDHGGKGTGHGRNTPEERTIFVIAQGKGVVPGKLEPPPGIVDIAVTGLDHLGVAVDARWQLDGVSLLKPGKK